MLMLVMLILMELFFLEVLYLGYWNFGVGGISREGRLKLNVLFLLGGRDNEFVLLIWMLKF